MPVFQHTAISAYSPEREVSAAVQRAFAGIHGKLSAGRGDGGAVPWHPSADQSEPVWAKSVVSRPAHWLWGRDHRSDIRAVSDW